ncbi:MAG: glycerol-3-phosphate dehydrogenase/oxidase [Pyrinomonadaceae bacterium]
MDRGQTLESVRERTTPWDIVVIGGGATGVGCAVDAATRGYDVLLLEQHDLGKGTSSRSTKLIHGGVRYLRQGDVSLVRESLRERGILLRNAPHVVHKQAFVIPCYSVWQKLYYGAGLKIYDLLSGKYSLGRFRSLSKTETLEKLPTIRTERLAGGVLYYDGRFDDTRLLFDLAATAAGHGASILNYAKVNSFVKDSSGSVAGLVFENIETGERFTVSARAVINATGMFTDVIRTMSDVDAKQIVAFSQGVHLVLDGKFLAGGDAIMIPKTSDGRVLFCIPWHSHTLIGTTDTPVETANLEPSALDAEIDFILDTAGEYLNQPPKRADVMSVFAGIRPLIKSGGAEQTSLISRGHDLFVDDSGLVTITGGKWTTYRRMAEDAVNKAAEVGGLKTVPSATAPLSIEQTSQEQSGPLLHNALPYTESDVVNAVRDEMARTVEDVLARRTRALFLNAEAAIEIAPRVATIMAAEFGYGQEWIDEQVEDFERTAAGYRL